MQMVKMTNKPSKNGFDLSRKRVFSAKAGELLPIMCIECIPDDSFEVDLSNFTRTLPVNTAAYTRLREYFDFFFVPTNLLWNKFNTFVTQMTNNNQQAHSYNESVTLCDKHPYFDIQDYVDYCTRISESNYDRNGCGFDRVAASAKLLNYLRYGHFNVEPTNYTENPATGEQSTSNYVITSDSYEKVGHLALNPFPLLAYQKAYSDYYRNSQWENAFAPQFNINYLSGKDTESDLKIPVNLFDVSTPSMFDLQYANWKKDMFTGVLPNSQYGVPASVISTPSDQPKSFISSHSSVIIPLQSSSSSAEFTLYGSEQHLTNEKGDGAQLSLLPDDILSLRDKLGISSVEFTVLALRQAEAFQKWSEITQSNQQDYKSQIEAHFGVTVSDAYSDRCKFVDGVVNNIDISEVVNNNITGLNESSIAGKGVGAGKGKLKFDTKVHGYFICIYHVEPTLDYSISGIERQNLKTRVTDYAIPEFDAIGMTQIRGVELSSHIGVNLISNIGYAPRYYDYKTSYDDVVGAFKDKVVGAGSSAYNYGYGSWVAPLSDDYLLKTMAHTGQLYYVTNQFFKINPSVLNPIFAVNATSETDSDQFLVNCFFDIKAVRKLDRNGLPY